jgi:3-phenylpropionate/trans-cinnamate dioxygenase ferredoxin subunit
MPADQEVVLNVNDEDLLDGCVRPVLADGLRLLLCRVEGVVRALADTCTHDGDRLSPELVGGRAIRCPRHGAQFDARDGSVLSGPATVPIKCYPVGQDSNKALVVNIETQHRMIARDPKEACQLFALDLAFGGQERAKMHLTPAATLPTDLDSKVRPGTPFRIRQVTSDEWDLIFRADPAIVLRIRWEEAEEGDRLQITSIDVLARDGATVIPKSEDSYEKRRKCAAVEKRTV